MGCGGTLLLIRPLVKPLVRAQTANSCDFGTRSAARRERLIENRKALRPSLQKNESMRGRTINRSIYARYSRDRKSNAHRGAMWKLKWK